MTEESKEQRTSVEASTSPLLAVDVPASVSASERLEDEAMAARAAARQQLQQRSPLKQQQSVPPLDIESESSASEDDDKERQTSGSGASSHSVAKAPSTASLLTTTTAAAAVGGARTPTPNAASATEPASASSFRGSAGQKPAASMPVNVGGETQLPISPRHPMTPRESAQNEHPDGRKRSQTNVGEAGPSQALGTTLQTASDSFLNALPPSDRRAQLAPDVLAASPYRSSNLHSPRETRGLTTSKLASTSSTAQPAISVDDYTSPRVRVISVIKFPTWKLQYICYIES